MPELSMSRFAAIVWSLVRSLSGGGVRDLSEGGSEGCTERVWCIPPHPQPLGQAPAGANQGDLSASGNERIRLRTPLKCPVLTAAPVTGGPA